MLKEDSSRTCAWSTKAHEGFVRGVCSDMSGTNLLTCGSDQTVKLWKIESDSEEKEVKVCHLPWCLFCKMH